MHFKCILTFALAAGRLAAQQSNAVSSASQDLSILNTTGNTSCNPWTFHAAPGALNFRDRACLKIRELASPGLAMTGTMVAVFGQWRNSPHIDQQDTDEIVRRFGIFYARHAGQGVAEVMAGYLHHEDPRYSPSGEQGIWRRTRAALFSVIATTSADGQVRPAFVPIAGALGSGFTSMAFYRSGVAPEDALRRSGFVYGHYFVTALVREFKPELRSLASRALRRKN